MVFFLSFSEEAEYRLVVLGSQATGISVSYLLKFYSILGKSCLICQLLYDIFPSELESTVEEMYRSGSDLSLSSY